MSDSIAERALLAHEAKQEEIRLKNEAEIVALRARAVASILLAAESFDLKIDVDDIEPVACSASVISTLSAVWWIIVPIDDDLELKIEWTARAGAKSNVQVTAVYPDQLYWDLPPGEESKGVGGGTYACYGLNKSYGQDKVDSLADLGKQILRTRKAREQWRKKWDNHVPGQQSSKGA